MPGPTCGSHCASSGGNGEEDVHPAGEQRPAHDRGRDDQHHAHRDRGQVGDRMVALSSDNHPVRGTWHAITLGGSPNYPHPGRERSEQGGAR